MSIRYSLPKGWVRATIGDITQPTRPRELPENFPQLPFVGLEHVEAHTMRLLSCASAESVKSSAVHFWPGDVLYGRLRPYLNKILVSSFEGLGSAEFIVFPKSEFVVSGYLAYFLNSSAFVSFASHLNEGDRPRVNFEQLAAYSFPLPPISEQHRIVAEIETQLTRLDASLSALKRAQANLKRYRASVLKAACNGQLVSSEGKRLSEAEVGPTWITTTIEEINPRDRRTAYGVLQPGPNVDNGTPLVRVGDIEGGKITISGLKRIDPQIAASYPRTTLQGGEVLLTIVGSIGRTAVVPSSLIGANTARAVAVIPLVEAVNPHWVEIWFRNPERIKELTGKAHEVARKTLNLEDVRSAVVMLPPFAEQGRIVMEVERRLSVVEELEKSVENGLKRGEMLRQAILRKAFAGELVPQDPNDEPSSVLLKRINAEREIIASNEKTRRPGVRERNRSEQTSKQPLLKVLMSGPDGLTPEQLLIESGHSRESIEEFYAELKREVLAGRVEQDLLTTGGARLRATKL